MPRTACTGSTGQRWLSAGPLVGLASPTVPEHLPHNRRGRRCGGGCAQGPHRSLPAAAARDRRPSRRRDGLAADEAARGPGQRVHGCHLRAVIDRRAPSEGSTTRRSGPPSSATPRTRSAASTPCGRPNARRKPARSAVAGSSWLVTAAAALDEAQSRPPTIECRTSPPGRVSITRSAPGRRPRTGPEGQRRGSNGQWDVRRTVCAEQERWECGVRSRASTPWPLLT